MLSRYVSTNVLTSNSFIVLYNPFLSGNMTKGIPPMFISPASIDKNDLEAPPVTSVEFKTKAIFIYSQLFVNVFSFFLESRMLLILSNNFMISKLQRPGK